MSVSEAPQGAPLTLAPVAGAGGAEPHSGGATMTVRALLVADRINTAGLERSDVFSTSPLSFRVGERGFVAVFRYGVVVTIGLSPLEEDEVLRGIAPRIVSPAQTTENEIVSVRLSAEGADQVTPDGVISLKSASPEHFLVVADVLAKSVALDLDERQVAAVFDTIEPWARHLSRDGAPPPGGRRAMLRLIGSALLVKHRVAGRVAAHDKPDVLWDRPDLDRLYGRLEDEYEISERAEALGRKLGVLGETATALTDLIDTERALRLELLIVILIAVEICFTVYELIAGIY